MASPFKNVLEVPVLKKKNLRETESDPLIDNATAQFVFSVVLTRHKPEHYLHKHCMPSPGLLKLLQPTISLHANSVQRFMFVNFPARFSSMQETPKHGGANDNHLLQASSYKMVP